MKYRILSLSLLCAFAWTCAAAVPPPDQLLANDTLAVFTVPDYPRAKTSSDQWSWTLLWKDPAMKPFREKFMAKLKSDVVEPLEQELGVKFADYAGLAQGQITFAITQNGWDGKSGTEPGFLLLLDAKDKSEKLKANLAAVKKKWVDSGKTLKTETIRNVEFTTLVANSDDLSKTIDKVFPDPTEGWEKPDGAKPKKPGHKVELLIGQSDSLLIVADSAKEVEKVLARQAGAGVPPLAEQAAFAAEYGAHFRDALAYGWINLNTIIGTLTKQAAGEGQAKAGALRPDKVIAALGFTGMQTLAFNVRDAADGCLVDCSVNIPEAKRQGLFKILAFPAKDANPPPFVPAGVVKFSRWRLDLQKSWAALESMIVDLNPQWAGVIKLIVDNAGKDKDPSFDLRKNLIANLGDDIISYQKPPRKQTIAAMASPPRLLLVSSPKAEQLAAALKALATSLLPPATTKLKEREFLGRKVYTLNLPADRGELAAGKGDTTVSFAGSGGYVALSTDPAMLDEFLRNNTDKPLRDVPGLAAAADKVGGMGTGLFGYENQREGWRVTLETLKKESGTVASLFGASPLAGRLGMNEDTKKFKEWCDFSLLPPFDQIAKYFHFTVMSGSVTPEGVNFNLFAPVPPQLKK